MDLAFIAVVGFLAQLIDGSLGMAYGVTGNSLLLAYGYPPAAASASVHMAELVTTGVSGHFHWRMGNVNPTVFRNLVWSGAIGGVLGAYLLTRIPADAIRPWIAAYLGLMGARILYRVWSQKPSPVPTGHLHDRLLGLVAGFMDGFGGGGWGPIVTTSLVGRGDEPRAAVGSANRAEFFVTLAQSLTFVLTIGITNWQVVAALCLGGVVAAPLAAHTAKAMRRETMMILVGVLVIALSLRTFFQSVL